MADPDRKINLDLSSDDDSDEVVLEASEITLVKEFEEEFKYRFTDEDKVFSDFCNQKPKSPPIVFPFEEFHHRGGGHNHRGRFQTYGHRQNFDNRRSNGPRYHNNQYRGNQHHNHHQQDRDRGDRGRYEPPNKRFHYDSNQSGGS